MSMCFSCLCNNYNFYSLVQIYKNVFYDCKKKLFLKYPAGADVAAFVVGLGGAADDDTVAGGGMDETETAGLGIGLDHNAGMSHQF